MYTMDNPSFYCIKPVEEPINEQKVNTPAHDTLVLIAIPTSDEKGVRIYTDEL